MGCKHCQIWTGYRKYTVRSYAGKYNSLSSRMLQWVPLRSSNWSEILVSRMLQFYCSTAPHLIALPVLIKHTHTNTSLWFCRKECFITPGRPASSYILRLFHDTGSPWAKHQWTWDELIRETAPIVVLSPSELAAQCAPQSRSKCALRLQVLVNCWIRCSPTFLCVSVFTCVYLDVQIQVWRRIPVAVRFTRRTAGWNPSGGIGSLLSVLCCQDIFASVRTPVQRSSTDCRCVNVRDLETSAVKRAWPTLGSFTRKDDDSFLAISNKKLM